MKRKSLLSDHSVTLCFLLLVVFFVLPNSCAAGAIEAWVRRHNSIVLKAANGPARVTVDKAGDVIVAGQTDRAVSDADMLTIKYSGKDGSLVWKRIYDGPSHGSDRVAGLAIDGDSNVIITGTSPGGPYNADFYVAKYSALDGVVLWERRFNIPAKDLKVVSDRNGNTIVTGYSTNAAGLSDFYTAKFAAHDGAILWERTADGPADRRDKPNGVAVDENGDILVAGDSIDEGGDSDYYTIKYAGTDGAIVWEQRYTGPNVHDTVTAVALDRVGNAIVSGGSFGLTGVYQYYTLKYAAEDGALIWEQWGPSYRPAAITTDFGGNVFVAGFGYAAKYAASDGTILWERQINNPQAVLVDPNGNLLITGNQYSNGTDIDGWTAKYAAADGALLWEHIFSSAAYYHDFGISLVMDHSGGVIVIALKSTGMRTDKYDATTGTLLWRTDYNDYSNGNDKPCAIAFDGYNNVVVTGTSDTDTNSTSYTAKYAAMDGALLWETRYLGSTNNGYPTGLDLDAHGNAIVVGRLVAGSPKQFAVKYAGLNGAWLWQRTGPVGNPEAVAILPDGDVIVAGYWAPPPIGVSNAWYVARYASLDGNLVWENHGLRGSAYAVAVDPIGNVIATGSVSWPATDFYTVKYQGSNGTILWEKRYNGPGNGFDQARAVAVDSQGNVAVAGSVSNGRDSDFYTAKYRSADGAVLWERSYSRAIDNYDDAKAVSFDRDGNVCVTGESAWAGTNYESYTAKYAAADGALLWERRRLATTGEAVAVDAAGDVIVAGNSRNRSDGDFYTAKYAASNGSVIWEKYYDSTGSQHDFLFGPNNLAVSGDGVVAVTGSSDGNLGSSYTYDFATVVYWEKLPPVLIERLPSVVRIRVAAISGRVYHLQRANDINGPWATLSTETAAATGTIEYLDNGPLTGATYYRVRTD